MTTTQIITPQKLAEEARRRLCATRLIPFIQHINPAFVAEYIHYAIAEHLEAVEAGEIDRLLLALAPRMGKSEMVSRTFPSWYMGRQPERKVIVGSYSSDLARGFGRNVRNIVKSKDYQQIFPGVKISRDSQAADEWRIEHEEANRAGEFFAIGTSAGVAGKGFNLGILDDPLSEQQKDSKLEKDKLWDWYPGGFYTRRQPEENAIVVMATRWAKDDLTGRLLQMSRDDPEADQWHMLSIPSLLDEGSRKKIVYICDNIGIKGSAEELRVGESSAPKRFSNKELNRTRKTLPKRDWMALYQQSPVDAEGRILKKDDWRLWPSVQPGGAKNPLPPVHTVIQCYDTAFEEGEEADYSARTTWGLFDWDDHGKTDVRTHALLMEAWKDRVAFPELRDEAFRAFRKANPDVVLVEKRASGHSLLQELKRAGVPAKAWLPPGRPGQKGKIPRAHAASVVLEQGSVWYPAREWALKVIDECADFPNGEHDDWVDTVTMALIYMRKSFGLELESDDRLAKPRINAQPKRLYGNQPRKTKATQPTRSSL